MVQIECDARSAEAGRDDDLHTGDGSRGEGWHSTILDLSRTITITGGRITTTEPSNRLGRG